MNVSETVDGANEPLEPIHKIEETPSLPAASPAFGAKTWGAALAVALIAGGVAWISSGILRLNEVVDEDEFYGGSELSVGLATWNAAVSYAVLGAILAIGLGATAGLSGGRRSIPRTLLAGIAGALLGSAGGAVSSYILIPIYFDHLENADLTRSILTHLGIWSSVGAASGFAFGLGSGNRALFLPSLVGGFTGGAFATLFFDVVGAFLPLLHTERPLAEDAGVRLVANLLVSAFVVVGIAVVASQKPRLKPSRV